VEISILDVREKDLFGYADEGSPTASKHRRDID